MSLVKTILEGNKIEYNDTEFEILKDPVNVYLHYIGSGINVTNPKGNVSCYRMFENFKGTSLDLSNFDTDNVRDMSFIFNKCYYLEHLNLSNFNTNKVTDMGNMFYNCTNLKTLNVSNFDTSNVTNMEDMFYACVNLKKLNVSNFDTRNVMYMDMFMNCKSLKELDISSFYIDNTKMLDNMFWNCINLKTLKVGSDYLQFFSINRGLLEIGNNVNIIPVSKLDKTVEDLFY